MYAVKRIAVATSTLAMGVLGATSTAAAATTPKDMSSTTAAPTATHHAAKGGASPYIRSEGCTPQWGVQVWRTDGSCTAFGFTGTAYPYWSNVTKIYTNNNYGWFEFNGSWHSFGTCSSYSLGNGVTLDAIEIDGYVAQGTC